MHHLYPEPALSFSGKARKGLEEGEMSLGVWKLEMIMKPMNTF